MIENFPDLINAMASLLSSIVIAIVALWATMRIGPALVTAIRDRGGAVSFSGLKFEVAPTKRLVSAGVSNEAPLPGLAAGEAIPADYLYLVHISFLRDDPDFQREKQQLTGVDEPHYDIRLIVDSYYEGALDRIKYVEYILHEAYTEPVQSRTNRNDKFLLAELANGEFVALAKVHLKGRDQPLVLQRYITLAEEGPRIEEYISED